MYIYICIDSYLCCIQCLGCISHAHRKWTECDCAYFVTLAWPDCVRLVRHVLRLSSVQGDAGLLCYMGRRGLKSVWWKILVRTERVESVCTCSRRHVRTYAGTCALMSNVLAFRGVSDLRVWYGGVSKGM